VEIDPVTYLLEVDAIGRLKARYVRFLDTRQWDEFRRLFTDDAWFVSPSTGDGGVGPADFVEVVKNGWITRGSIHHVHSPEIELTETDSARATWSIITIHRPHDPQKLTEQVVHGYGYYDEQYRKEAGEWKISSLKLTLLREDLHTATTFRDAYGDPELP
jgi:3-phenylpropionate/cinnamic acid dioxygenase small subunit